MATLDMQGVAACDSDFSVEEILERFDPYIIILVQNMVRRSSNIAHPAVLDLEADEIAQRVRINFWKALEDKQSRGEKIEHPKAYIRTMVSHMFHDIPRKRRLPLPLPTDDDGEIYVGDVMVTQSEGMADPAYEFDQKEGLISGLDLTADVVSALPPRQKLAMIGLLQEKVDDRLLLMDAFLKHEIDIDLVKLPEDKADATRLKASISAARHSIARLLNVDLSEWKEKGIPGTVLSSYSGEYCK